MFWTMPPEQPDTDPTAEALPKPLKGRSKSVQASKHRPSRRWGSAPVLTANLFVVVMVTYLAVLLSVRVLLRPVV
jgi:hypothetical protein